MMEDMKSGMAKFAVILISFLSIGGLAGFSIWELVAAFMDAYNQTVRAARGYQAQTVKGGLGTGGLMPVDGASKAAQ